MAKYLWILADAATEFFESESDALWWLQRRVIDNIEARVVVGLSVGVLERFRLVQSVRVIEPTFSMKVCDEGNAVPAPPPIEFVQEPVQEPGSVPEQIDDTRPHFGLNDLATVAQVKPRKERKPRLAAATAVEVVQDAMAIETAAVEAFNTAHSADDDAPVAGEGNDSANNAVIAAAFPHEPPVQRGAFPPEARNAVSLGALAAAETESAEPWVDPSVARIRTAKVKDYSAKMDALLKLYGEPVKVESLRARFKEIKSFAMDSELNEIFDQALAEGLVIGRWDRAPGCEDGAIALPTLSPAGAFSDEARGIEPDFAEVEAVDELAAVVVAPVVPPNMTVNETTATTPAAPASVIVNETTVEVWDGNAWYHKQHAGPRSAQGAVKGIQDAIDGKPGANSLAAFTAGMTAGRVAKRFTAATSG